MATPSQPSIQQAYHSRTHVSATDSEGIPQLPEDQKIFRSKKFNVKIFVVLVKLLLFVSVLTCLVFNKLTLIKIIADLHMLSNFSKHGFQSADQYSAPSKDSTLKQTANLYWILFFIVLVPNIITWIWSLFSGVMKKSSHCPWPKYTAIMGVVFLAFTEAITEIFLVFFIFITLPPEVSVVLMCGVYSTQSLIECFRNIYYYCKRQSGHRSDYMPVETDDDVDMIYQVNKGNHCVINCVSSLGFLCQFAGLVAVTGFLITAYTVEAGQNRILGSVLAVPCLLLLSFVWSRKIQKLTYTPMGNPRNNATARWRANFIATSVRLIIYPFASYLIFRFLYQPINATHIDPWATIWDTSSLTADQLFQWDNHYIWVFSVHVITSFLAYALSWLACYMTLHVYGLALPILLATPLSLAIYFLSNSPFNLHTSFDASFYLFPFQESDIISLSWKNTIVSEWYIAAFGVSFLLWIGQQLASGFNLFKVKNAILASDEDMFVRPYFNSIFLEQYLAINRDVSNRQVRSCISGKQNPSKVFVCSTMFRENTTEMTQMLRSIGRIAKYFKEAKDKFQGDTPDTFESHIFFDGGCRENELLPFAIQLTSLLPGTLGITLTKGDRQKTPYGYRFTWYLENIMPFVVHLKDNLKIRNKKRWSQVMYMNYIIDYRFEKENFDLDNTFILTTDADIDFKAESAVVLLDMLARNSKVGAVCARTHPLGYGPLYWYQIFDYAIGHWLQKSTEHILGSVLCSPGCFSMFRCSALKDCLKTYSSEVTSAMEFLMKDMGEDRWLCTLLVEKGWRLEYCAISNDYTYCPVEFDEFYKQRRRWIPSTIANLWLLVAKGRNIIKNNKSISWIFILYEIIIITSTIISPATVILFISSGLLSFGLNNIVVIVILVLIAVGYSIVCMYASQKVQLDIAKILTFVFAVVMVTVAVGIIKETVKDIVGSSEDTLNYTGSTGSSRVFPVAWSTFYLGLYAIIYIITAVLNFPETLNVFHFIWYVLGLPSGYLLLLIYSTANLNDRRWGTREAVDTTQQALYSLILSTIKQFILKCLGKNKEPVKQVDVHTHEDDKGPLLQPEKSMGLEEDSDDQDIVHAKSPFLSKWLKENQCEHFYDNFAREGYTEECHVSTMKQKDLINIGIKPIGYVRRLEKAIKELSQSPIHAGIPKSVESWISELKLDSEEDGYIDKFHEAGYCGKKDVENLIHITEEELKESIGVKKKAHLNRFKEGIKNLKICSQDEENIAEAEKLLQMTNDNPGTALDDDEYTYWLQKIDEVLHPIPDGFTEADKLRDDLRFLRNYMLLAMLMINLIWIILLTIFTIEELEIFHVSTQVVGLIFLAVYGVLISIQFIGMLLHRLVTLAHYIARLDQSLPLEHSVTVTVQMREADTMQF